MFSKGITKAIVCLGLLGVASVLVFANIAPSGGSNEFSSALDGLRALEGTYVVSNVMELPDEKSAYIEINSSAGSYTEYPLSSDGEIDTTDFLNATNTEYTLYDWLTPEGKMYVINQGYTEEESDNMWVELPDSYAEEVNSRKLMYADLMEANIYDVEQIESQTVNLGGDDEEIELYTGKIPSEIVKEVCGMDTLALYQCVRVDASKNGDKQLVSLADKYISELDMSLVYSDGKVTFGVIDGVLRYLQLEAGGLGCRMYYTKTVLLQSVEERDVPDFSSKETYYNELKSLSDYVSGYDSYEDAISELLNQ